MTFVPHRKYMPVTGIASILYIDEVRTSQEAYACYVDSFTLSYVNDVRTSQEAQASTVYYGDSVVFLYVDDVCTSHGTLQLPVKVIASLFICEQCLYVTGNTPTGLHFTCFLLYLYLFSRR
jgi:hypothetical protein